MKGHIDLNSCAPLYFFSPPQGVILHPLLCCCGIGYMTGSSPARIADPLQPDSPVKAAPATTITLTISDKKRPTEQLSSR